MTGISKEEEDILDKLENGKSITLKRGNETFTINLRNIQCYGNIDFNKDSTDMSTISNFNWLSHISDVGICMPAKYDYDNHCAYSDLPVARVTETFKPEVIAQYGHGVIGKPKRVVIFKQIN